MPNVEHSSITNTEVKLAPQSLNNFAGAPNTAMNLSHSTLATVLAVWSLVMMAKVYLVKWSVMTKTFFMLGGLLSSIVDSMLVKSTWTSSRGV